MAAKLGYSEDSDSFCQGDDRKCNLKSKLFNLFVIRNYIAIFISFLVGALLLFFFIQLCVDFSHILSALFKLGE